MIFSLSSMITSASLFFGHVRNCNDVGKIEDFQDRRGIFKVDQGGIYKVERLECF